MKMIPWRRPESLLPFSLGFDDFFKRFWENGDSDFASHLPEAFQTSGFPAVNFAETEDTFSITVDCPGMNEEDFEVEAMGNNLLISGERSWEEEKKGKEFRRVESQYGKFSRTIPLPENVRLDPERIEATYKKGVLKIEVPKLEKTPAARIAVHAE